MNCWFCLIKSLIIILEASHPYSQTEKLYAEDVTTRWLRRRHKMASVGSQPHRPMYRHHFHLGKSGIATLCVAKYWRHSQLKPKSCASFTSTYLHRAGQTVLSWSGPSSGMMSRSSCHQELESRAGQTAPGASHQKWATSARKWWLGHGRCVVSEDVIANKNYYV